MCGRGRDPWAIRLISHRFDWLPSLLFDHVSEIKSLGILKNLLFCFIFHLRDEQTQPS